MRRILAASLAVLALSLSGQASLAQTGLTYTIRTVTPASVASGSGDTVFVTSGAQTLNQTRYNICYYNGATSATIVPTAYNFSNPAAVTYTFTVPGARFQTGGAAATPTIYAAAAGASNPTGCTGTNPGISNTVSSSITAVNYAFRTATPSTIASGSADTSFTFTGSFPTFPANTSGLGLCFYAGTNNAPLLPSSQASTANVTFLVPSATFANAASARIYLAPATSTCNGTNPGYGGTFAYTITQGMRFNIQEAYPASIAAGGGNVAVSLYGNLQGTGIPNNGVCFYTGPNTTPTAITPTSFTTTEIDFVVPASALQIPPASFTSGTYNAQVQLGTAGGSCTTTAQGISNVYSLPIGYPTVDSASVSVLPQVNLNSNYTYYPTNLELYGNNFGAKFSGRFIPAGGTQFETTGLQIDQNDAVVQLLRPTSNTATTALYGCNYSPGNVYEYCSTTPLSITNYALATSATQIASSPASPAPGSAVTLSASITPGAGSTTAGGTFVPGPPSGTVTFSDNGTSLGTATLAGGALRLAPTGTQNINIYAGSDSIGSPVSGESRQPEATAAATPNETPNPDINSQFTSLMADFNKDGINDTLLIQSASGIMHLFLGGSPLGTLQSEQTIYPGSNYYCSSLAGVTVADFNGDGFPDIAYLCGDSGGFSNIQVLLNQGDGSFGSSPVNIAYGIANQLAAADVNKDGKMDLVASGNTGTFCCTGQTFGIQVYTGDGTGNFTTGALTTTADIPGTQVVLKDLNNDGAPDLVFLHYDATAQRTEVALWQNDGTGRFTKLTALPVCNCQVTNSKLFVTPLNTSSLYPDIVVDYSEGSNILAFVNKKTATIGFTALAPALYSNLTDVVLGDFNGDGFTDFAQYNGTNITMQLGNGTGTFALNNTAFAPYTVGSGSANLVSLTTAPDLNGDGYADLVAIFPTPGGESSSTIASYVTTGTAAASLPTTLSTGGSRTITTVYAGNRNVLGSNGSQAITVGRAAPTITWNPATTTNTTTALGSTILNATASVPGSFAYTPAAGSFLAAGTQTITAVFTPTDTNTYSAVTTTRTVTVSKTTPVVTTTINPGNHTYTPNLATTYSVIVTGANIVPTGNVQANNSGSPVGALAGLSQSGTNQSSTQILFSSLPAGTFAFTGSYLGDAVYNAVTSTVTNYTVSKSTPTLTYTPTPTTITYGTGLVAAQLNATAVDPNTGASIPGSVTYSIPTISNLQVGSILPAGGGATTNVITATFVPSDATDYASITKTASIVVNPLPSTTTLTLNPSSIIAGQSSILTATVTSTAGGTVPGQIQFSSDDGTIPNNLVTLSNGVATLSYTPAYNAQNSAQRIYATYSGYFNGGTGYASSNAPQTILTVRRGTAVINFVPNPATITYGTPLSGAQLNATESNSLPGTFSYTPALGTVLPAGVNTISALFSPSDSTGYASVTKTATVTVTQFTPTFTWATPASISYGTPLSATQLNANSARDINGVGVPGTYSYSPAAGTVLPIGDNPVTATFTPSNTTNFTTASITRTVTVTPGATTTSINLNPASITLRQSTTIGITVTPTVGSNMVFGQVTVTDSNGTITPAQVSLAYGVASISYTPATAGLHTITVSYPGNSTYAASSATAPLNVGKGTPAITFNPAVATIPYGTPLSASQLNATSSVPGTFSYNSPIGTVLNAGVNVITATFTPTDTVSYATVTKTATVTVTKFTPVIVWPTPAPIPYSNPIASAQNAVANDINGAVIPGGYVYNPASGIFPVGTMDITVTFNPSNPNNFNTATATRTLTITAAPTTTTLTVAPASITLGQSVTLTATVVPTSASGSATGTVTFTDNSEAISPNQATLPSSRQATLTYTPTTAGTHLISASYNGVDPYSSSATAAPSTLVVGKGSPVITFAPNPATIPYGTPLSAAQLNAVQTTSIPGAFSYSYPLGTVLPAGNAIPIVATFTPTDTVNYATVTKASAVTVSQFNPVIVWAPPAVPFGTPNQFNAVANDINGTAIPGTYSYSSPIGTILPVGANPVNVTFMPTDRANYTNAVATRTVTVVPASTTTALVVNPASINLGQSTTLTATVTPTTGSGTASGSVTFSDNSETIPSSTVAFSNGVATLNYTPSSSGTHLISASYTGAASFSSSTTAAPSTLAVGKGTPVITFAPNPATIPYGTPLSAAQLNAAQTGSIPGAFSYSSPLGTVLPVGTNTITATFTPTDTVNYTTVTKTATVTVTQFSPVITWAASTISFGTALSATQLNAVANDINGTAIPGTYSYSPTAGTILPVGANQVTVTFTPTNTTNFATATATRTITVIRTATVTTLSINPAAVAVGQPSTITATVTPTSGAGPVTGQVSFTDSLGTISPAQVTLVNGVATFSYTPTAVGTHVITVSFPNSTNYSASSAGGNLIVGRGDPVINFTPNPATIPYGTPLSAAQLNAVETTGTILGAFSYSSPLGTVLNAGANTITATFTPTDTTSYSTIAKTAVVTVTQFTPVIVWAPPAPIPFGTPLSSTQLNAVANDLNGVAVPGAYSYNPAAGTVLPLGTTQDTLTFTPTSTTNFATAAATRAITVVAASTTTALNINPGTITLGQSTTLTATVTPTTGTATATGTVTFTDSRGTIPSGTVTVSNGVATLSYTPAANGTHTITATYSGSTNYSGSSGIGTLAVGLGLPVITFAPNPSTIVYGTPLSAAQLNAVQTTSIPGTFSYSSPLGTVLPVGANVITATFTPTDTTSFATVTKNATVTVTQAIPTITWTPPASTLTNIPLDTTILNATASIPGTFAYTPAAGSYLSFGTATLNLLFTPTDNTNYQTASASRTIAVGKANPTPILLTASPASQTAPNLPVVFTVSISGTNITPSGIVRLFESTTLLGSGSVTQAAGHNGTASITVSTLTSGVHSIVANIAADTIYNEATSAPLAYNVGGATVPITFAPNPATIPYGTPLSAAQLNATSTIPGVFTYSPALNTILDAGANTITATFTPTDTATYATTVRTATVTVTQFTPVIAWAAPNAIPYGTPLSATQLNAVARDISGVTVPGTYSYNPAAGTVLPVGTTQDTVSFTPTNTQNFAAAASSVPIAVNPGATTTTLGINPGSISLGQSVTLTATVAPVLGTAPIIGSVVFTDSRETIPSGTVTLANGVATLTYTPTANGTHAITASFPGNTTYSPSFAVSTLAVGQGLPVITFAPNPATIPYGTPLSAAQLNAVQTTSIPGVISYSSPLGTVLPVGANTLTATFTPTDTATYATATRTATVTVTQFPPVVVWATPAAIAYGTALSATQLNAAANDINGTAIPGTYAYAPPAGTVFPVGTTQESLTFTPTNTTNFATVTATRAITVTAGATATTVGINPGSIALGQSTTLTATVAPVLGTAPVAGSVTFTDNSGAIPSGTVTLSNGVATLAYTPTTNGTHSITATYSGNTTYAASTGVGTLAVGQGLPIITFAPNPATIPYGTPLSAAQLNAVQTTSIPGVLSYSSPLGTVLNAGTNILTATFTPTDTAAYAIVTKTATITVLQGVPTIAWNPNPSTISFGTPLSAAQLNAAEASGIPGTIAYSSPLATILPVGTNTLTATFTPTDAINYTTATGTAVINVTSAASSLSLAVTANNTPVVTVTSGTVVTLTATLATVGTSPVYGQVNFCDTTATTCTGTHIVGSAQLTSAGTATLRLIPAIGGHTYQAAFLGTKTNVASTSASSPLVVTGTYPTVTTFTTTGATGNFTLNAVVTGTGSPTASPTGTVSFLDTSNANAPLATATLGSATTSQTFPNQTIASGLTGSVILTGDFNGDGIPDIVTGAYANPSSSDQTQTFSVFLGNGDATFALKSTLASQGVQVVTGDFNHDGIVDLAVFPNSGLTTAADVLLGNGDGTFTRKSQIAVPSSYGNALVADFNHDGILDLAIGSDVSTQTGNTTTYTGTLAFYQGTGDGTFASSRTATTPSSAAGSITADFNGDGIPDILASGFFDTSASVLLGKGDGTFTPKSTLIVPFGAIAATTDLDNDGTADLAVVNFYDTSVSTYLGKGDGTFTLKATIQNPAAYQDQSNAFNIAFADFNQDGNPDFAVTADDGVFIYSGASDGTFTITARAVPQTTNPFTGEDFSLAVADFNKDGLPDVVTNASNDSGSTLVLALNTFTSTATATATNVSPIGAGAHQVVATYPGNTSFRSSASTPINLAGQTFGTILTWTPAPLTLGTPLGAAQLNAVARDASGNLLPGTFAYTPAAGTTLPVGRQPLSVIFTPADLVTYTVTTLATTVQVNGLSTTTALASSPNPAAFAAPVSLVATITPVGGSSTTPLTGSVTFLEGVTQLGTAQVANGTATLPISTLSVGSHLLTAVYSGDTAGNYLTSTSTILTQVINTTTPAVTWTPNPATIVYGTRLTSAQLNAVARDVTGATLPGTFTYTPAVGAILPAGTQTLSVTFTPTDTVRYTASTATAALTVTRATPTIAWNTPAPINQGTALSAAQLNATATGIGGAALPGIFTYSPAAGAILAAGAQTLNVTFTPTDAANYLTATGSVALTVLNPTTGTVLTSSVNPSQFGQPTVLTATIAIPVRGSAVPSGNVTFFDGPTQVGDPAPITVTSTGATATLTVATLGVGAHQLTAAYANDPNYVPSTSLPLVQTITIAPVTLAWTPTVATIPYGTPLSAAQLNAVPVSPFVPNVSGLLTYTPAAGIVLSAGTQTLTASFTPTDTADFLSAAGSTVITVTQATPTLTWPTPAAIAQGTALSATQLNATATGINNQSLPGTFTYTPAAGAVLQAGTTTLRVLFTPSNTVNYTTATATVPLNVSIPSTTTTVTSSLSPSQSGQSVTFTATVAQNGNSTQPLTGTVTFFDGAATLGTSPLTSGSATFTTTALSVATHTIRATYNGTVDFATSTSSPLTQTVTAAATRLAWTPNPASIVYGTPLSAAQLNAVASSVTATIVPGAYTYTPAAGTVLSAGTQTLSVTFTPTEAVNFTAATATTSITVTKATPTVTFSTPAPVAVGTALSSTQLAATSTGITGATLPGTFTYTPAAGTLVVSGPQTLSVTFTPTDTANYNAATATATLNGTATTLTALSATTAFLGDPTKTLTLTGTGFVSDSVARANGIALATTYVSPTTLTATLPATTFRTVQTLQVAVNNPTQRQTTSALPFTVSAPAVVVKVNAPSTANPGDQPTITSALAAAYPVDVTGTFNLTFQPISGGVVDPAIQFATGGTTSAFTIAAGQTNNPNLQIQTGTVAGTITVRLTLTAGGADVTPTGLAPLVINVPTIAPTITSVTLTRSGRQLTVRTLGFSNTREVNKATFHFVPSAGQQIQTQDVTVDVGSIFAGWYSQSASTAYGSTFLYAQTFTLDDDASVVGQVTVTLGNSVGASASGSSQ